MKNNIRNRIKIFSSISGVLILGKILGLVKQTVMASTFGATIETDLISISEGLIANAEYLISSTLITAFVSVYLHVKAKIEEQANVMVSDTIVTSFFSIVIIDGVILVGAPVLSKIIAPSYSKELSASLTNYLRVFSPILIPYTFQAIFSAVLNANSSFIPGQMMSLNQSVLMIISIFIFKERFGVDALVIGFFMYSIFNSVFLYICSKKYWRFERGSFFHNDEVVELFHLMLPMFLAYSMVFLNQIVDKIIVSGMEAGAVTALAYGSVLSNLVTTFISAFCTVIYTKIASTYANGELKSVAEITERSVLIFVVAFLPITILTFIFSEDIVWTVFGYGAFKREAVVKASWALKGYCLCFVPYSVKSIYSRALYGNKNTKVPTINTIIGIVINIGLSILLYKPLGIFGVAFASSFAEVVSGALNIISARKNNTFFARNSFSKNIRYLLIAGLLCTSLSLVCKNCLINQLPIIRFLIGTIISLGAYCVLVFHRFFSLADIFRN